MYNVVVQQLIGYLKCDNKRKFYYPQKCITVKVQDNNTVIAYPANSRCCSREISDVLRKPNVHYGIHKSRPLVPILGLIMQLLLSGHNFVNLVYSNSILLSLSPVFYSERFVPSYHLTLPQNTVRQFLQPDFIAVKILGEE